MAPKKKGNKNAQEDWEAELGESIAPAGDAPPAAEENGEDGEAAGGGGLMAMLRKNKEKRKKKGIVDEEPAPEPVVEDLSAKAPVEASLDDDEFALPQKKGKGGKGKPAPAAKDDDKDDLEEPGRILTKAEKEKLKKEREKQRKKEQVRKPPSINTIGHFRLLTVMMNLGCEEEDSGTRESPRAGKDDCQR